MIISRKAVVGAADFNAAIVCPACRITDNADTQIIRPYMYTYVRQTPKSCQAHDQFYSTVAIDAILTIAIAFGLWKSKTGWSHTDALIKRIIMYVLLVHIG